MTTNAPRLLSTGELAALLAVNGKTIHNHVRLGRLTAPTKTLGGHDRYDVDAVIGDYERCSLPVPGALLDYRDGRVEAMSGVSYWIRRASVGALRRELARRGVGLVERSVGSST